MSVTYKVLSAVLSYPTAELQGAARDLIGILNAEQLLPAKQRAAIGALIEDIAAADLLESEADEVAAMMTLEMGKTLTSAKAEALKCVKGFRYYADHTATLLADEVTEPSTVNASRAFARYQPLGVVLAVMPWNFPLWQAVRFAAPALMAGNVGLLKHASNVPQTALYLADLLARAGFPDGCFQTLLISSGAVERVLVEARGRGDLGHEGSWQVAGGRWSEASRPTGR